MSNQRVPIMRFPGNPVTAQPRAWLPIALSMFTIAWGGNEFSPLLVLYRQMGHFTPFFIDLMLVSYAAGVAIGLLVAGPLSDRWGRKPIMLAGPVIAVAGSLLIALGETEAPLMTIGRFLSGVAVGVAMTAGGSWIKELARPEIEPGVTATAGAKRAAMSLTAGFGVGPLFSGVIAQWGPYPAQTPFILHIALSLALVAFMLRSPETNPRHPEKTFPALRRAILVPTMRHRRFLLVVIPISPWVFGANFTAFAILPNHVMDRTDFPIAFTAILTFLTLGSGFAIQQFGPRIAGASNWRGPITAMSLSVVGMALAVAVVVWPSLWLILIACVFLGMAYGLCMYIGISEVQKLAVPADLAGLTGIYYCGAYSGMIFPAVLTKLSSVFSYPVMLGFGVFMALATLALLSVSCNRYPPSHPLPAIKD